MDLVSRVGDAATSASLRVLLREDWERFHRSLGHPGLHALVVYRWGHWARSQRGLARLLVTVLYRIVNVLLIRNIYGVEISPDAMIGRRVLIGHHQALQIPAFCVIGDDTVLRHNVNIGSVGRGASPMDVPHVGRKVRLGPGCCLVGPIRIGHGARIGPNCVVMSDVPDGATVVAPPPRVFKAGADSPVGPGVGPATDVEKRSVNSG